MPEKEKFLCATGKVVWPLPTCLRRTLVSSRTAGQEADGLAGVSVRRATLVLSLF
jgi:hypothetical protein